MIAFVNLITQTHIVYLERCFGAETDWDSKCIEQIYTRLRSSWL